MDPRRFYLLTSEQASPFHGTLHRSDDDGATWQQVHEAARSPDTHSFDALAYDPANPDRVFVAESTRWRRPSPPGTRVKWSRDGGVTWDRLGTRELGSLHDLALAADGRVLYAATETGLWQQVLPSTPARLPPSGRGPAVSIGVVGAALVVAGLRARHCAS